MSNVQIIIDKKDIRFDAAKTMSERIIQRPFVLVVIVGMGTGKRYNISAGCM
jgi:hypothetical protein